MLTASTLQGLFYIIPMANGTYNMENFPIATSIEANIIDLLISQQKENIYHAKKLLAGQKVTEKKFCKKFGYHYHNILKFDEFVDKKTWYLTNENNAAVFWTAIKLPKIDIVYSDPNGVRLPKHPDFLPCEFSHPIYNMEKYRDKLDKIATEYLNLEESKIDMSINEMGNQIWAKASKIYDEWVNSSVDSQSPEVEFACGILEGIYFPQSYIPTILFSLTNSILAEEAKIVNLYRFYILGNDILRDIETYKK